MCLNPVTLFTATSLKQNNKKEEDTREVEYNSHIENVSINIYNIYDYKI